jgi:hypothetical protein
MQQEIISILSNSNWLFQREIILLLKKRFNKNNDSCIAKALCSLRKYNELDFKCVEPSNYIKVLKLINREDVLEKRMIFTHKTFVYRLR